MRAIGLMGGTPLDGIDVARLAPATVETADAAGWPADAPEAQAVADLAVRSPCGLPLTFPKTAGVPEAMKGGALADPARI